MNCFEHQDKAAVGICKICGKGVCQACAKPAGLGIYCSDACASYGANVESANKRTFNIYGIGQAYQPIGTGTVIYGVLGAFFSGFGAWSWYRSGELDQGDHFAIIMGLVMMGIAIYAHFKQRKTGLHC